MMQEYIDPAHRPTFGRHLPVRPIDCWSLRIYCTLGKRCEGQHFTKVFKQETRVTQHSTLPALQGRTTEIGVLGAKIWERFRKCAWRGPARLSALLFRYKSNTAVKYV